jgi:hypothetical protein
MSFSVSGMSDFTGLQATILDWLADRVELSSRIPTFIALAERRMYRQLRAKEMQSRAVALLNAEYEYLPYDFIEIISIAAGQGRDVTSGWPEQRARLRGMSNGQLENTYGMTPTGNYMGTPVSSALPEAFAVVGKQIRFAPRPTPLPDLPPQIMDPTQYRNFEAVYWQRFQPLSDANATNIILDVYPELYLYGALIEAEPYLVNDERIGIWKGFWDEAIRDINKSGNEGKYAAFGLGTGAYG